ncbi:MAG: hypothetical protein H9893_11595 [Candidatus Niameybacter stercoravium]|nr:hypothetical protein [Candidatus Niameybacter stercoravium]
MKICYIRPVGPTLIDKAFVEVYKSRNTKAIKFFVAAATLLSNVNMVFAGEVEPTPPKGDEENNPIKKLGTDAISMIQLCLTIIAIIMALLETAKAMLEGDPKRIPSVVAKYGIGVIITYAVPWGFFKIREAFDGWEVQ